MLSFTLLAACNVSPAEDPTTIPQSNTCVDDAALVSTDSAPANVEAEDTFSKTWRLRNTGTCDWGVGYQFVQSTGNFITANPNAVSVPATTTGGEVEISLNLTISQDAPIGSTTAATFQMRNASGQNFGAPISLQIEIKPGATSTPRPTTVSAQPTVASGDCLNESDFVRDINVPDGTLVQVGIPFTKTWRLENSGTCTWTTGYRFVMIEGDDMLADAESVAITPTLPGREVNISMVLTVPNGTPLGRTLRARFQLQDALGQRFGTRPFVEVEVGTFSPVTNTNCDFDADFVEDITFPDNTDVERGTPFIKTWRLRNVGTCAWDSNTNFVKLDGSTLTTTRQTMPIWGVIEPGEEIDISYPLTLSTAASATSRARFQLSYEGGFGQTPFVQVEAFP